MIEGEKVVITRHGKPVAELLPISGERSDARPTYHWLRERRLARACAGLTSVEILNLLYEPQDR